MITSKIFYKECEYYIRKEYSVKSECQIKELVITFDNKNIKEAESRFLNGKEYGIWTEYDENGCIMSSKVFNKEGNICGIRVELSNNRLGFIKKYKENGLCAMNYDFSSSGLLNYACSMDNIRLGKYKEVDLFDSFGMRITNL
jgi:antitoxin component YwqK of YwqJK toxin-antitoxin module